jgi:hypothetical protein
MAARKVASLTVRGSETTAPSAMTTIPAFLK